jgi:hypothetical protein
MTGARSPRRNPYRPGTLKHAQTRRAELSRRKALAEATAARAKKPEALRRAKRRASVLQRSLRDVDAWIEFRGSLNDLDRWNFDNLPSAQQKKLMSVVRKYPKSVLKDVPDPFAIDLSQRYSRRGGLWSLYYSTRAGIRQRTAS